MPVIVSREKQVRKTAKKRLRNRAENSGIKSLIKQFNFAIEAKDQERALEKKNEAFRRLDRSYHGRIHHRNFINRTKSALDRKYNTLLIEE